MKKANTIMPVSALAPLRVLARLAAHSANARVAPETLIRLMRPPSSSMNSSILMLSRLSAPSTQKILSTVFSM